MLRMSERNARTDSMHDRASVRGVKLGRPNRKRRPTRSSIGRAGRRIFGSLGRFAAGVALLGALGGAAIYLHRFATTSPRLAIETVEVEGAERATRESLVRLSGVELGQNTFAVDLAEVAKNVEAHPWVKRAEVSRRLPRGLNIKVEEHRPVMLVALGHLYYANAEGQIVKRYAPGEREALPVLTGIDKDEIESDDGEARARLLSAVGFLEALKRELGADAPELAELHSDPNLGLSFLAKGEEARVVMGEAPWGPRLLRYLEVKKALSERGVRASEIVLSGERRPDRAVARLVGGDGAAAAKAETNALVSR